MYTQGEAMTMMAMGVVLQWVVEKAIQKLEAALQRYRAAAGLPGLSPKK